MISVNIIGQKYGLLTVVDEVKVYSGGRKKYLVKCVCECGQTTLAEKSKVKCGATRSCGCLQKEMRKNLGSKFKKPNGEAAFNECYGKYKKSAYERGYVFELSKPEFLEIILKPCIYCGRALTSEKNKNKKHCNGTFKYTGIDRYDNKKGYTKDNCVPCCSVCNRMKSDMDVDQFESMLTMIMSRKDMWKRTA